MDTVEPDTKFLRGIFVGLLFATALSVTGLVYMLVTVPISQ